MRPDSDFGVPVMLIGMTIGHSRPLAAWMVMSETDCCFGIGPSLDLADRFFPIGAHVARKCPQSAHIVGARHLEEKVDIGERAVGAGFEPLPKLRPHIEQADGIGQQHVGGGRACSLGQTAGVFEDRAGKLMVDMLELGPQVRLLQAVRTIRIGGEPFGDIEQFGFGEADQGSAQQRAQRQSVARIGERARQCNEILDFLPPEEAFAGLGRDRDSALFERFLEAPQLGANRREQRDVAKARRARFLVSWSRTCSCRPAGCKAPRRGRPPHRAACRHSACRRRR